MSESCAFVFGRFLMGVGVDGVGGIFLFLSLFFVFFFPSFLFAFLSFSSLFSSFS